MKFLAATFATLKRRPRTRISVLLPIYFLTLSLVNAFNLSDTITIAIILSVLMAIALEIHQFRKPRPMRSAKRPMLAAVPNWVRIGH